MSVAQGLFKVAQGHWLDLPGIPTDTLGSVVFSEKDMPQAPGNKPCPSEKG